MGTYYYLNDSEEEGGVLPVYEDNFIQAIFNIAEKRGIKITDKIILKEVKAMRQKEIRKNTNYGKKDKKRSGKNS